MLNYEVDGNGPPLLMIHGFGISFHIWQELRTRLRDHFTLIMVELPGIGDSPLPPLSKPYLVSAIDGLEAVRTALGIERWCVLGYSSGSRVAEHYLQRHAERIERAVFLCPALTSRLKASSFSAALRLDRHFPQLGNWILSGPRIRFLINLLGLNLTHKGLLSAWFDEITSQPVEILKETLRSMPAGGAQKFELPDLPALFIWGRADLIMDRPHRLSAHDRLIRADHSAPQTDAQEVGEVILSFLVR
jgi:pimeloyl-ACP methyl ester carboxylesterase